MKRIGFGSSVLAVVSLLVLAIFASFASGLGPGRAPGSGADYAIIEFLPAPLGTYRGGVAGYAPTAPAAGGRLDLTSPAAMHYASLLAAGRAAYVDWLARNEPRALVLREFSAVLDGIAVELRGAAPEALARGPGVRAVTLSWLYQPVMSQSVGLIHAPAVWSEIGLDPEGADFEAVRGIQVGVIDTGIDDSHPFLASCREPGSITHQVFYSGVGTTVPSRTIFFDHGTHVAGTIGGCPRPGTDADPAVAGVLQGVAPGVGLHDYNVFPGYGAGFIAFDGSAFSHDIIAAVEQAVLDGMDVINLSLSGAVQGPHDTLAEAIDAAAAAGVVAAVSAGNEGPGDMTVGSPGNAAGALTAGASTNPHYAGISAWLMDTRYGAVIGDYNNFDPEVTAITSLTTPANGCTSISEDLTGKIAIIDRGACTFGTKIRNAEARGAVGVLIVNNLAGDPIAMAADGGPFPSIPAAMLSRADGAPFKENAGAEVTVDGTDFREYVTTNSDIIAPFSSRGPAPFEYRIKPDVTAPGVNVLSSVFDGKYEYFQGTSMAAPHVAGAAVLLLAAHPAWSPDDVKSALVNTADRTVTDYVRGTDDPGVLARGGGRINLETASKIPATLTPASVSFGLYTGRQRADASQDIWFRNQGSADLTCSLSVSGDGPVTLSSGVLTIPAGGSASVTLMLAGGKTLGSGDYSGDVVALCDAGALRAPWWTRVDRTGGQTHGAAFLGEAFSAMPFASGLGLAAAGAAWASLGIGLLVVLRRRR